MDWYDYIAYFFAGGFLCNGLPHFMRGITGRRFQSPFASPPGIGESSALINVIWGMMNFVAAYALFGVGDFDLGFTRSVLMTGLGFGLIAVFLALYFEKVNQR